MIIKENVDNIEEFNHLYDAVGWGAYDAEITKQMLARNIYSVSAYEGTKCIGYGRLIGDGISFIYIHDVMVDPDYQGRQIGTKIMKRLLAKISEIRTQNPDARIYLGASKGKEGFYEKFGFVAREEYGLGPGMILGPLTHID